MGVRVAGLRPISTSPVNFNSLSKIRRGRVAFLKRPISTYNIITTSITTMIISNTSRGIVVCLKRHISTSYITLRHSKTFIIINTIIIMVVRKIMAGLSRAISNNSITNHLEISCLSGFVSCIIFYSPPIGFIPLSWCC